MISSYFIAKLFLVHFTHIHPFTIIVIYLLPKNSIFIYWDWSHMKMAHITPIIKQPKLDKNLYKTIAQSLTYLLYL